MVSMKMDYFDLARICASGQIFRMYDRGDGIFDVYSGSRHIRLRRRKGNRVDFFRRNLTVIGNGILTWSVTMAGL